MHTTLPPNANIVQSLHWCLRQRLAGASFRQLRSATSRSNGVSWQTASQRFRADVIFEGKHHYAGLFVHETEAAHAFDAKLRQICKDPVRLKKSLNFPTEVEASYEESLSQKRSRGLRVYFQNTAKEVQSHQHLQDRFANCPQASDFEIVKVPSQSRIDALFRARGSKRGGLALQLKSGTCRNRGTSKSYLFGGTKGYENMLLVLIALDCDLIWMVPGSDVSQKGLRITLGSQRDEAWRASQIGLVLSDYFTRLPHVSLQDALLQCGRTHIVEEHSHSQLVSVFASVGLRLHRPASLTNAVDSVLGWQGCQWRIQEKAAHMHRNRFSVGLRKHGGCLGRLPYSKADFDILIVSLLDDADRLMGIFAFPSFVLAKYKLIGHKAVMLTLYPPWSQPKCPAVARKHSWQSDHFVDMRSWKPIDCDLDPGTKANLTDLLDKLRGPVGTTTYMHESTRNHQTVISRRTPNPEQANLYKHTGRHTSPSHQSSAHSLQPLVVASPKWPYTQKRPRI